MTASRPLVLGLVALLLAGCARNAIFELEIELPPQPPGSAPLYAVVEASERSFESPWEGEAQAIPLAAACARPTPAPACDDRALDPTCSAVVSVIDDGSDLGATLRARIRFCVDRACGAAVDASAPEHRVVIDHPFYPGRYTQARACIDALPTALETETVERCEVRCREGSAALQCRLDGTHFCEP